VSCGPTVDSLSSFSSSTLANLSLGGVDESSPGKGGYDFIRPKLLDTLASRDVSSPSDPLYRL